MSKIKANKIVKRVLKVIGIILGICVLAVVGMLTYLTITEYKPEDTVALEVEGEASKQVAQGDSFTVMSWNIGYGDLANYADFFMGGGSSVQNSTKDQVQDNVQGFIDEINTIQPDILFLQEVDVNSKRSYKINQKETIMESTTGYNASYARNFKVEYVPYPLPTIGKVDSGIMTFSKYDVTEATRVALPNPFSYPVRMANLKRCLLVSRIPVEGSDKELVLVNLHLEAFDDGEGKVAQTKILREFMQKEMEAGNYVIAGGDFNQTFTNVDASMYPKTSDEVWQPGVLDINDFGDGWQFFMDNQAPTCRSTDKALLGNDPETFQYYMIDGFIVSDNVQVESVATQDLKFEHTDHNPVVMKVTLK